MIKIFETYNILIRVFLKRINYIRFFHNSINFHNKSKTIRVFDSNLIDFEFQFDRLFFLKNDLYVVKRNF